MASGGGSSGGMVRKIVFLLIVFSLIMLGILWAIAGGPRRLVTQSKTFIAGNPSEDSEGATVGFHLPWQPANIFPVIDISDILEVDKYGEDPAYDPGQSNVYAMQQNLIAAEEEYDQLNKESGNARALSNPSPFRGKVFLEDGNLYDSDPNMEYLTIAADYGNTSAVDIVGWSIESAISGARFSVPPAASPLTSGGAVLGSVTLEPSGVAYLTSGASPVGASFRENICTGYLVQSRDFTPSLSQECPNPSDTIPMNYDNLQRYGDGCFSIINATPSCTSPQNVPNDITPACRSIVMNSLSYNGCVNQYRNRATFQRNTWRLYVGSRTELWRNSHDALRLLDAQGRTVDVLTY